MDPVEDEPEESEPPDSDAVTVRMGENDTVWWVRWPSLLAPGTVYLIGWPMKVNGPQQRTDH